MRFLSKRRIFRDAGLAAALAALVAAGTVPAWAGESLEAVDPDHFRVCAEPDNLPYSNDKGEGFQNKIAELFAKDLGKPLVYDFNPMGPGFFVNTLNAKACDLAMGVPAGLGEVLNTNPYYRMTYVMVYRKDSGLTAQSVSDPALKKLKIGTVAGTPPNFLLAENDLLLNMQGYQPFDAVQNESVGKRMIADLKDKKIDVALMAGPVAGYWAKMLKVDVVMLPLENAKRKGGRMDYLITMGVRDGEDDWKHEINDLIKKNQAKINEILASFGVPVLKMVGPPVPVSAKSEAPAGKAKPEAAPKEK
jgi:quinoprotein dehydrogenase-associated probable ABC transporter substrate-binding protein